MLNNYTAKTQEILMYNQYLNVYYFIYLLQVANNYSYHKKLKTIAIINQLKLYIQ